MSQIVVEQMPNISASALAGLQSQVQARRRLLEQRIAAFEKRYQCSLIESGQQL